MIQWLGLSEGVPVETTLATPQLIIRAFFSRTQTIHRLQIKCFKKTIETPCDVRGKIRKERVKKHFIRHVKLKVQMCCVTNVLASRTCKNWCAFWISTEKWGIKSKYALLYSWIAKLEHKKLKKKAQGNWSLFLEQFVYFWMLWNTITIRWELGLIRRMTAGQNEYMNR